MTKEVSFFLIALSSFSNVAMVNYMLDQKQIYLWRVEFFLLPLSSFSNVAMVNDMLDQKQISPVVLELVKVLLNTISQVDLGRAQPIANSRGSDFWNVSGSFGRGA